MARIEILSTFDGGDPVYRGKIMGIARVLQDRYRFEGFTADGPCLALLLRVDLGRQLSAPLRDVLVRKARSCQVHLFVPDFEAQHLAGLAALDGIVHTCLVPTPETRALLRFHLRCRVEVLPDPVDFHLDAPRPRLHAGPGADEPLRLAWFGYPESYEKSMVPLQPVFEALAARRRATLSVITSASDPGPRPYGSLRRYQPGTILAELDRHDAVVLSHVAFDFSVNTHHKSENKAVLAIHRGLPVVATCTPAYARLLTGLGLDDWLFDDAARLAANIERLREPGARNAYLAVAQPRVAAEYGIGRIAAQWERLLVHPSSAPQAPAGMSDELLARLSR